VMKATLFLVVLVTFVVAISARTSNNDDDDKTEVTVKCPSGYKKGYNGVCYKLLTPKNYFVQNVQSCTNYQKGTHLCNAVEYLNIPLSELVETEYWTSSIYDTAAYNTKRPQGSSSNTQSSGSYGEGIVPIDGIADGAQLAFSNAGQFVDPNSASGAALKWVQGGQRGGACCVSPYKEDDIPKTFGKCSSALKKLGYKSNKLGQCYKEGTGTETFVDALQICFKDGTDLCTVQQIVYGISLDSMSDSNPYWTRSVPISNRIRSRFGPEFTMRSTSDPRNIGNLGEGIQPVNNFTLFNEGEGIQMTAAGWLQEGSNKWAESRPYLCCSNKAPEKY